MDRREFIKCAVSMFAYLSLPLTTGSRSDSHLPWPDYIVSNGAQKTPRMQTPPPAPWGRIATWWRQAVRTEPSPQADLVTWKGRDEIIPLYAATIGEAPWPGNPVWYQTKGGFIHSGYVQPAERTPNTEIIAPVLEPGFWAQVCIPIVEAHWQPHRGRGYKLYYGTVYRVVDAVTDEDGHWWYQLQDGITFAPGPYVPTEAMRRIPPEELAPISPGRSDKWIEINLETQSLSCIEGETTVFSTGISSGAAGTPTPRGEHRVLYKRHTRRMIGGSGDGYYDLPGIAFPVYFTHSAVAIHGTYWHNDFCRPHSHGCVNVSNQAAQWIFRWVEPVIEYTEYERKSSDETSGTRIVVT
ncbi:MAG TPA: murein L,D-transpeptidase [Chloroflexi bacterium]|nr:murein L,D-transpeptidase [Chloroflexota bacterium]